MGKIYTKKGDKGTTGTMLGRLSKSDQLPIALGTIDELNSFLGVCRAQMSCDTRFIELEKELYRIQNNLLNIGSGLAGSGLKLASGETRRLEVLIDKLTDELPELKNFIFPTGYGAAAYLQVARTIARRAEREVVKLVNAQFGDQEKKLKVDKRVLIYLNRLSDALFTFGRWTNAKLGNKDEVWGNKR